MSVMVHRSTFVHRARLFTLFVLLTLLLGFLPQSSALAQPAADVTVTFHVEAQTVWGENIFVVGNVPALGSWNPANAVPLTPNPYPQWVGVVALPANTTVEYKYIKKDGNNAVTWEPISGNRTLTTPASGSKMVYDKWGDVNYTFNAPARAIWLNRTTFAWNGTPGNSYKLLYDADGGLDPNTAAFYPLVQNGTISGASFPKNPNTNGMIRLDLASGVPVATLLKGQVLVASYNANGALLDVSQVQIQSVLDDVYATFAQSANLGVTYNAGVPTIRLWAPTAKMVSLLRYADSTTSTFTTHAMTLDATSGVWSVTGASSWNQQFYVFAVDVYVPATDTVEHNLVSDPYSLTLSRNSQRSQIVDLYNDPSLKPSGWDTLVKPALVAPEDISVYEVHVRDFSINDASVPLANRGTFKAFTNPATNGMQHIIALKNAGLTHIHLLPAFDIASVNENASQRTEPDPAVLASYPRDSSQQQAAVGAVRLNDGFNWGYDPLHYGAPEGSYSTNPDGVTRIIEFRQMVQALNQNGLRVVMDVVYNHTSAFGQNDPQSILDHVVPGYYHRYTLDGLQEMSSCCADTASEYTMMEKLMLDTVKLWATAYKVDGFRFDLMNLHTVQNAVNVKTMLQSLTIANNGVDGSALYVYGEGWDFGSAAAKGLNYAKQSNMYGTGIGTFNDRIRDAAHGGYNTDSLQIRHQGFINGLSYDWNGYLYNNRAQSDLWHEMSRLRLALMGSIADYTADPQESINYVSKHDNETLFDQNIFKMPASVSMSERVRAQNMGLSLVSLAQGIPFYQLGVDMLRSKSLDRNSYDSGDWFNKVDFTYQDNNFGVGLPPAWDNQSRWGIMQPLLANTALDPTNADILASSKHLREMLRVRQSSRLFRLTTAADINTRVNVSLPSDALIVMTLNDAPTPDLDPNNEFMVVLFNANKISQTYSASAFNGMTFSLHPVLADGIDSDPVVQTASFNSGTGTFTVPARTTAVFVSNTAPVGQTGLGWVGNMYPVGGYSTNPVGAGKATPIAEGSPLGLPVYVQVYKASVTEPAGQGSGIGCYVYWGLYGQTWSDLPMTYNRDIGNNDEYKATIPTANLAPGTYGFTTYCTDDGGLSRMWRVESDQDRGDGLLTIVPNPSTDAIAPTPPAGVYVHLFEWKWTDIQKECTFLAQKGYKAVQISPPMEHILPSVQTNHPWWVRYQVVSYKLDQSRSGTQAEFQQMVTACNNVGVDIYVDAVINHMTGISDGNSATGTAGTVYSHYNYPTSHTDATDFHYCGTTGPNPDDANNIFNYSSRYQVQNCELLNLADLNANDPTVQQTIRAYLQGLLNLGVKGFRLDASKHMASQEIKALLQGLARLDGSPPYVFQEVIDQDNASEPIKAIEYTPNGDVTEFKYSVLMGTTFNQCGGSLANLQTSVGANMLPSQFATVFTDNHDNQRGHGAGGSCVVDYQDGAVYNLANIFTLAQPYGYPQVMSSYAWTDENAGPPTVLGPSGSPGETLSVYGASQVAGDIPVNCNAEDWICEHRRTAIANMVQFRRVTNSEAVSNWHTISANHIAFGRGSKGFVAINRESSTATTTYQTSLSAGQYCNITKYDFVNNACVVPNTTTPAPANELITVSANGQIINQTLNAMDAFAIHASAKLLNNRVYLPLVMKQ